VANDDDDDDLHFLLLQVVCSKETFKNHISIIFSSCLEKCLQQRHKLQ
jgi:hypothetical protein